MDVLKSELLKAFIQYVLPVAFTGLASLLGWVFLSLQKKLEADAKGSAAAGVGAKVLHLAQSVVADLEAIIKPELVERSADGVLSKADVQHLRELALDRLKQMLGVAGIAELEKMLGVPREAVDKYLTGMVEKAVDALPSKPRAISQSDIPTNPEGKAVSPQMAPA